MLETPLHSWHQTHHGRMVEFAGWDMPVLYSSIVDEHHAVRRAAGLFDISHMGRLYFDSPDAGSFLNQIVTIDTAPMQTGQVRYSLVCREDGGILDDVLVYRLSGRWMLVVNASNRTRIVEWLAQQPGFHSTEFRDETLDTAMIAVQGPRSIPLMHALCGQDLSGMKYYSAVDLAFAGTSGLVSRTGYTGEDGFELIVPQDQGERIWQTLLDIGQPQGLMPAGLGCRDTLRLEAGMPLYGHELSESVDPLTAGLAFAVRLGKSHFIGRDAIAQVREQGPAAVRVGLVLDGRRIARENTVILAGGEEIGRVTSGTFSPTLQQTIAMAYVRPDLAKPGQVLDVDLRGTLVSGRVTALPFYRRS